MPEAIHSRQELERRFLDVCRDHGVPMPAVNVVVAGLTVDAFWREQRLVVELDSRQFHLNARAFEEDREREAVLLRAGCLVLRITWKRLTEKPAAVATDILALLARTPT
jgi:very-short-patch-repair endonuclease